jgi:hypothetical protein
MVAGFADALLDTLLRRLEIGMPNELSPAASLTAVTMAATLLALEETLFRRVTRCGGMSEPDETE